MPDEPVSKQPLLCTYCSEPIEADLMAIVEWRVHGSELIPMYGERELKLLGLPLHWILCKSCIYEIFQGAWRKQSKIDVKGDSKRSLKQAIAVAAEDIPAKSWIAFGDCKHCNGTGKLKDGLECLRCKGTGWMAYRDKAPDT